MHIYSNIKELWLMRFIYQGIYKKLYALQDTNLYKPILENNTILS